MSIFKQPKWGLVLATALLTMNSCSKEDNNDPSPSPNDPLIEGDQTYVLGVGVTDAENNSTNYVVHVKDLTSGEVSLMNNGILQEGYRKYITIGNHFYAIGGLGVTDANAYYIDSDNYLRAKTGMVFQNGLSDFRDFDNGKTLLGVQVATDESYNGNVEFFLVDAAGYQLKETKTVPAKEIYPGDEHHGWSHSGIAVRGNQAFQGVFPMSTSWTTPNTDTNYVAVYGYPEFELQKVIKDVRTGPTGSPLMRSGIFATENGNVYTVSHDGYGYEQSGDLKEPAILRIKAGEDDFDSDYLFKTTGIPNGGRIIKALYIGDNKLFAQMHTKSDFDQWDQTGLKYAIVDLEKQEITAVKNSPVYDGAEDPFLEGDKIYIPAKVGSSLNIYEVDIPTATAKKGLAVDATYVLAVGKLTK
ncbi:MAG: DUF4374 domain-containing protein [Sphingobacterium sp.]